MSRFGLLVQTALSRSLSSLVIAAAGMAGGQASAAIYTEVGDAGQTQGTAQATVGVPTLTDIFGSLRNITDADLFVINIFNPLAFSATTVNALGGTLDTQLFLFTLSGAPVYMNDDADGTTFLSTLPAGNPRSPVAPGLYLLGISFAGYDPVNAVNQLLFDAGLSTDVRGPAPLLQPGILGGFADNTFFADSGRYDIQLTGARGLVPEPASWLLVALAGTLCALPKGRRRSKPA